jgi:hypothetical protein
MVGGGGGVVLVRLRGQLSGAPAPPPRAAAAAAAAAFLGAQTSWLIAGCRPDSFGLQLYRTVKMSFQSIYFEVNYSYKWYVSEFKVTGLCVISEEPW